MNLFPCQRGRSGRAGSLFSSRDEPRIGHLPPPKKRCPKVSTPGSNMKRPYKIMSDCIHYRGEKPCHFKRECEDCPHYESQGYRILIIKFGAMGDVLRTTSILQALKKNFVKSQITWVTAPDAYFLLKGIPSIDRLFTFTIETKTILEEETFDIIYCFDKTPVATALGARIRAKIKKGFALSPYGTLDIYDEDSAYALRLGLSDPLKFNENQRSYQDVLFEMAGLSFQGEHYQLAVSEEDRDEAKAIHQRLGSRESQGKVALNTGCGDVFKTKQWPLGFFARLASRVHRETGSDILLLGGPGEEEQNRRLEKMCDVPVYNTGTDNPIKTFAAIIESCRLVVASDTLAMHLAIAVGTPVVALFGSTCHQEIDLYGNGVKLCAGVDCSPCYKQTCSEMDCMKQLSVDDVFEAINQLLSA